MGVSTDLATPTRRARAVKRVVSDKSLSTPSRVKATVLFSRDIAVCDTYLAIDDPDVRKAFLDGVMAHANM